MEEILHITYKGDRFTLKELIEDNNAFSASLKLYNTKRYSELLFMHDMGYMIANEKLKQVSDLVATSRFALIEAHKKLHKSPVEWRSGYPGQIWLRTQYLKNAIVWYNSILDYVYQIVWFAFDFYKKIDTKLDYQEELRACSWRAITQLKEKLKITELNELYQIIINARNNFNVIQTNKWANSLKHHGNLSFKELQSDLKYSISFEGGLNYSDISGEIIDLDGACLVLKETHIVLHELITNVVDFVNFEAYFTVDDNGDYRIDGKDKCDYKKILFTK
jgi:hypothetical protein